jgi:hypothetical protein
MKVVVYTALVGNYDYLRAVPGGIFNIDFICFADQSLSEDFCKRKGWMFRPIPKEAGLSRRGCRQIKSMPHKFLGEYEISIWLDSNISFNKNIQEIIEEFSSSSALIRGFRHVSRDCAYSEAEKCISLKKDTEQNLNAMVVNMLNSGFPENYGLTETNVLFRKHHDNVIQILCEEWSYFLGEVTVRDQVSFDFLCWRHGVDVIYFNGSTHGHNHPVFNRGLHKSNERLKNKFAYIESFQGVYPCLRKVIKLCYSFLG